jgi:histidinol-phosphate aminotransferase
MRKPIREYVPQYVREIAQYVPGRPIEEVERELKISAIKLASNENPLGPSPLAVAAAKKALAQSNRYPDGSGFYLRQALSKKHNLPAEQIILGAGSTELIDLSARLMLRPENTGVTSLGSFPLYYIAIRAAGAKLVEVPLREYRFDLEAIARSLSPEARIVFLANPNNPTGTMFTAEEFDAFLSRVPSHVLVVLDEAYCDYIERPDYSRAIDLVRRGGSNLIVLRTFSKAYGLAGLRIAYGLGPAGMLEEMNKIRGPFNTSGVAQAAALAALDDHQHVRRSIETNRAGLAQLAAGVEELGIRSIPSVANFILAEFGYDTEQLCEELTRHGVIVRPMRWMGFPHAIRISVGTRAENEKLLSALADLHVSTAAGGSKKQKRSARKTETHRKARNNRK